MIPNKRQTIQRTLVMDAVSVLNHPTADEVYREVRKKHPSISCSTVYRNLHHLVDGGKLISVSVPNGPEHFDHTVCDHYHIVCSECGRVDDISIERGSLNVIDDAGYCVTSRHLIFEGVCPGCASRAHSDEEE